MERFRDRFKARRLEMGLSSVGLSRQIGCSHGYVDGVERNKFRMTEQNARAAAEVLGTSFEALTIGTDFREPMDRPVRSDGHGGKRRTCKMRYECEKGTGVCCETCEEAGCESRCQNSPMECGLRMGEVS